MVEFKWASDEVFAGLGGDGVAGAVVFGEGFDLLEVMGEVVGAGLIPSAGGGSRRGCGWRYGLGVG